MEEPGWFINFQIRAVEKTIKLSLNVVQYVIGYCMNLWKKSTGINGIPMRTVFQKSIYAKKEIHLLTWQQEPANVKLSLLWINKTVQLKYFHIFHVVY